jgi:Zn-dependent protease
MAWVAAAGPGANLVMALAWGAILKLGLMLPENAYTEPMLRMAQAGVLVNLVFMFLNLLPILPLDGGRILASLLPNRMSWQYAKLEPWGLPVLFILLATHLLDAVLNPLVDFSAAMIRAFVLL